MSSKTDGNKKPKSAKVLKLGFNISVSGDPDADFEIVLDDKEQKAVNKSSSKNEEFQCLDPIEYPIMDMPNHELEKTKTQEVNHSQSTGAISKNRKSTESSHSSESPQISESEKTENSIPKDSNIVDQIKSTMEHFEKFSEHIKEIPRLRNQPVATSTPLADKYNSKSDSNLIYQEYRPRKFSHKYDFISRKEYFRSSVRPLPQDLFLKPLPAEGYYKRGIYSRYLDVEPYRHFGSDSSLNKSSDYKSIYAKSNSTSEKPEECNFPFEHPSGILKKSDSESADKQSTSSADSVKDIKIYQSGGILIMQNFKDNMDFAEKKEMSEFSAKLIENCNKLKMEVSGFQDDIPAIGPSCDENKSMVKTVQFDLSSFEGQKSKSGDSSSNAAKDEFSIRMESSESTSDCMKNKDSSPQGTSQSQDFPSLSTQENDSILSNQPGMSPSYSSSKKLEWDSGADVGYLNLDLTKENLSTIEKIVLKGLSSDGKSEKNVVYEKQPEENQTTRSKFILERKPSDLVMEGQSDETSNSKNVSEGSKREIEQRKVSQDGADVNVTSKGEIRSKFEEIKSSSNESSTRKISTTKPAETKHREKTSETTDKSVNVNTLFHDVHFQTPQSISTELVRLVESPKRLKLKKSPKIKTKIKNRLQRGPKKTTSSPVTHCLGMGGPKKVYKKVEAAPELNDVELSREVEEIIIDQSFKRKQNVQDVQGNKEIEVSGKDKADGAKEVKAKGRPISASSAASNSTVLRKFENFEKEKAKTAPGKFNDQIIQTSDCDCESVGIQAFSSQKSSDFDFRSFTKNSAKPVVKAKESINTSSKNIQAFGLNSSLPKQLAHPKGTELIDKQHTKSTQFFGGPLNSLPNYHSNLVTKPGESCGRMPNILKTKRNFEAEVIRLKEENEKNILANDASSEPRTDSKRLSSNENKENLITKKSNNSKRSQSRINSKGNETVSQDSDMKVSEEKAKKKSASAEGSDCPHTSDEVSSMILTSEVLKVHGDSIDRNIIKEKYFQSQLVELEKRKMISRSTSMEIQLQLEDEETGKEYTTTGCQYSPQSRDTTSGGQLQELEDDSSKENSNQKTERSPLEQYGSSQQVAEEHFVTPKSAHLGAGDSLPSSTQTAHSWLPGVQNSRADSNGVGRARSFEYLPGHIYESSGNLREELPSETEQNLITSSSESYTAKGSASDGGERDSEGRNTLILENSSDSSQNSNQMKILDDNLSRLSSALLKFWEKDAQVQSITQSLFMNFWRKNGSGDWLLSAGANLSKTEGGDSEDVKTSDRKKNDSISGSCEQESKQRKRMEFSIACQTEGKSPSSDPEKLCEDRKALEKRISEEKKSQIKWIENEIHHLNILRKLLEKQNGSIRGEKKQQSESNEISKSEDSKNAVADIHPAPITPVYGCTVFYDGNNSQEPNDDYQVTETGRSRLVQQQSQHIHSDQYVPRFGGQNDQRNDALSIGVQVSLNDSNSEDDCEGFFSNNGGKMQGRKKSYERNMLTESLQSEIHTQFPSGRRASGSVHSASIRSDFSSGKCNACGRDNCFCLNFSEKSYSSANRSNKRMQRPCIDYENKTSNSTDPDLRVMESGPVFQRGQNDRQDLSEGFAKAKFTQGTNCRCQNCPKRMASAMIKAGRTCRGNCQSNIYLNCEKPTDDCRCSKVQIQKSSNCHIIKIHGPKCCSAERFRKQNFSKKTENQSCQTDSFIISESKLLIAKTLSDNSKQDNIIPEDYLSRRRAAITTDPEYNISKRIMEQSVKGRSAGAEYLPSRKETEGSIRSSIAEPEKIARKRGTEESIGSRTVEPDFMDSRREAEEIVKSITAESDYIPTRRIIEVKSKNPEKDISTSSSRATVKNWKIQTPEADNSTSGSRAEELKAKGKKPTQSCSCRKKAEKEREKDDDHPRHYFLRIEEAEVDDESVEQKKSLEVITVTVPVRKAGKGKIYNNNVGQSSDNQIAPNEMNNRRSEHRNEQPKGCNCCAECSDHTRKQLPEYEPSIRTNYRRKADAPTRTSSKQTQETENFYEETTSYPSRQASGLEYYQDRNNGITPVESSSFGGRVNGTPEPECCESCTCSNRKGIPSRSYQNDYNSHKKNRTVPSKEYYDGGNARFYDSGRTEGRNRIDAERDRSTQHRPVGKELNAEYYNYNKREYMTKSEIIKEEKQKRRAHQPTLQEYLASNRPDFYNSAERRRHIISERAQDRVKRHKNRMECLMNVVKQCSESNPPEGGSKRIFTTVQMREQTMKRYRNLPEVTGKMADQKKKDEYRTNRLMAEVFAKKLQIEALKGHINLSNSVSVLYTI